MSLKVSVIIPVYNAAKYLRSAVKSALEISEVSEIVLIEDRSPDNSLELCQELVLESSKVKLYHHPNRENRGAGASRNLGIELATSEFIAFLDADDLFLPNRFTKAAEIFDKQKDVEGVYGAAGFIKDDAILAGASYTIRKDVAPESLFGAILRGTYGHFHTNSITLRKSIFKKTGYFNPDLRLGQDADLWLRIAFHCKLVAGEISEPICLIRRHAENRILRTNHHSKIKGLKAAIKYFKKQNVDLKDYYVLVGKLYKLYIKHGMIGSVVTDFPFLFKL